MAGLEIGPFSLIAFLLSGSCKWLCICILQHTDLKKPQIYGFVDQFAYSEVLFASVGVGPRLNLLPQVGREFQGLKILKTKIILPKLRQSIKKERSIVWWLMVSLDNKCGGSFPSFIASLDVNRGVQHCSSEVLNTCCVC